MKLLARRYISAFLLCCIAVLAGCDTGALEGDPELTSDPGIAASGDSLRIVPWPAGAPLLGAGNEAPFATDGPFVGERRATAGSEASAGASPYGCYVSTLDPDGKPFAYQYSRVYLHFPEDVLAEADGRHQDVASLYGSRTLYAAEGSARSETVVGRFVLCRIPDTPAATPLLREQIRRFRPQQPDEKVSGAEEHAMTFSQAAASLRETLQQQEEPGGISLDTRARDRGAASTESAKDRQQRAASRPELECAEWSKTGYTQVGDGEWHEWPPVCVRWTNTIDEPTDRLLCGACASEGGDMPFPPIDWGGDEEEEDYDECDLNKDQRIFGPEEETCARKAQAKKLADFLEENPLALLDVPCDEVPKYEALAKHVVPQGVINRLENLIVKNEIDPSGIEPAGWDTGSSGGYVQSLGDAAGPAVNMDYYGARVHESNLPGGMSAEEYYQKWRTNFNDYFDDDGAQFEFYPGLSGEEQRWQNSPLGTIFSIQLKPFGQSWIDDGSVVTSQYDDGSWTFSTAWTPEDFRHPVSGNREFGFERDGSYVTFYTRGVDRITARDYGAGNLFTRIMGVEGGIVFSSGDKVWKDMVDHLMEDIGGGVEDVSEDAIRPDYDKLLKVIAGEAEPSILGCDE